MPRDPRKDELLELTRQARGMLQTAQLFGEDDFSVRLLPAAVPKGIKPETSKVSADPAPAVPLDDKLGDKRKRLEELYRRYDGCTLCSLSEGRTKIVFGVGSVDLKVLFVGEGPGFDEDKQGFPFVGKAGQLLDKIMNSIGLDRTKNAYIANMVKCHPMKDPTRPDMRGNDRPPTPSEMLACREILDQQIEILNPPVICVLGSTAARALLDTPQGITAIRGRLFDFKLPRTGKTIPLIPTYHPAALLRNEDLKKDVWQDMKFLRTLLQ